MNDETVTIPLSLALPQCWRCWLEQDNADLDLLFFGPVEITIGCGRIVGFSIDSAAGSVVLAPAEAEGGWPSQPT